MKALHPAAPLRQAEVRAAQSARAIEESQPRKENEFMLALIGILLIVLWLLGFAFHIAGGLIHLVLVIAVVMFLLHFLRGRS
jgi:hypothetical protein